MISYYYHCVFFVRTYLSAVGSQTGIQVGDTVTVKVALSRVVWAAEVAVCTYLRYFDRFVGLTKRHQNLQFMHNNPDSHTTTALLWDQELNPIIAPSPPTARPAIFSFRIALPCALVLHCA